MADRNSTLSFCARSFDRHWMLPVASGAGEKEVNTPWCTALARSRGALPSATAQRFGAGGTDQGEETVDARP